MNAMPDAPTISVERTATFTTLDRDALLQASRRVDWRFLLPQPDLQDTAYIGAADGVLIDSLRQFCTSLTMLTDGEMEANSTSHFPLVVASNPTENELCQAVRAASAGGFVYVEVRRRPSDRTKLSGDRPLPRTIRHHLAAMRRHALSQLQVHWHWPSFESCSEIIPFDDRAAGICTLRRRGSGIHARWKSAVARLLLESHLLGRFIPCFSVLGQRCQDQLRVFG